MAERIDDTDDKLRSLAYLDSVMGELSAINGELAELYQLRREQSYDSSTEQAVDKLHILKGRRLVTLLQARALGTLSFQVNITRFPQEQFHPYSRNTVVLELPAASLVKPSYYVGINLNQLVTSQIDNSEDALKLIHKCKPYEYVDENPNPFVIRSFYEIEDVTRDIEWALAKGDTKLANSLYQVKARIVMRILEMRDNQRKGIRPFPSIPIAVGFIEGKRKEENFVVIRLIFDYTQEEALPRGVREHFIQIPTPAAHKKEFKARLRQLLPPYDFKGVKQPALGRSNSAFTYFIPLKIHD